MIFLFLVALVLCLRNQIVFDSTDMQHSISPLDLVTLDRLSGLELSPSGQFGVFTRSRYNTTSNKQSKNIWLLHLESQQLKSLTVPQEGVSEMEMFWLSDDKVGFLRKTPEYPVPQLLSVDFEGNEEQLTSDSLEYEIENLKYDPQSQTLYFTSQVYANEESSLENTKFLDQERQKDPSSYQLFDKLYFRHWDQFDNHKNSHLFSLKSEYGKFNVENSFNWMKGLKNLATPIPPFGDKSHYDYHNGQLIFASMKHFQSSEQAWSTETHIYKVIRQGQVECLSCQQEFSKGAKSNPSFSPNGQKVAWLQMNTPQFEADQNHLMVLDLESGHLESLTENYHQSISSYIWLNDEEFLISCEDKGRYLTSVLNLKTKSIQSVLRSGSMSNFNQLPNTKKIVFQMNSMMRPNEFYMIDLETKNLKQLTEIHSLSLSKIKMSEPEEFWYEGALGEKVMGWILKPVDFDPSKKYPLAYLIHGGPQGSWTDSFSNRWNPEIFAGAGFVVAMVNFHGSTGYGQKFVNSISKNWGSLPYEDVMIGLDYVIDQYNFVDSNRTCALGASYGGFMINWLNGHTQRFKCLVNHDGLFDVQTMYYTTEELFFTEHEFGGTPFEKPEFYREWNPSRFVGKWKTPTLVIQGGKDYRVPPGEGFATFTALQRQGIPSKLLYFPDENHWVLKHANSLRWHKEVLEWIQKWTQ